MKKVLLHLAILLSPGLINGQILIHESFEYDVSGTHLNGVAATGVGLSGNWTQRHIGAGESNIVAGLSFGSLQTSGNAFQLLGDRLTAGVDRYNVASVNISATTTASTVWHSHLVQFQVRNEDLAGNSTDPHTRWQSTVAVHSAQMGRGDAPSVAGFSATRDGSTSQGRLALAAGNTNGGAALNFNETYMVVGNMTGLNDDGLGVTKTADMWVLSLANFNAFLAGGANEAALDANNVFKISRSVTNDVELALEGRLNIHTLDWDYRNFMPIYDEIRFGTSLDLVTPIPEPSTYAALFGMLALGFVAWRRRR